MLERFAVRSFVNFNPPKDCLLLYMYLYNVMDQAFPSSQIFHILSYLYVSAGAVKILLCVTDVIGYLILLFVLLHHIGNTEGPIQHYSRLYLQTRSSANVSTSWNNLCITSKLTSHERLLAREVDSINLDTLLHQLAIRKSLKLRYGMSRHHWMHDKVYYKTFGVWEKNCNIRRAALSRRLIRKWQEDIDRKFLVAASLLAAKRRADAYTRRSHYYLSFSISPYNTLSNLDSNSIPTSTFIKDVFLLPSRSVIFTIVAACRAFTCICTSTCRVAVTVESCSAAFIDRIQYIICRAQSCVLGMAWEITCPYVLTCYFNIIVHLCSQLCDTLYAPGKLLENIVVFVVLVACAWSPLNSKALLVAPAIPAVPDVTDEELDRYMVTFVPTFGNKFTTNVNPMWTISQYLLSLNSGMFRQVNASTLRKDIRSGHTKISFTGRTSGEAVTLLRAGHLGKTFKKLRLSDHATFAFVGGLKGGVTASLDNAVAGPSSASSSTTVSGSTNNGSLISAGTATNVTGSAVFGPLVDPAAGDGEHQIVVLPLGSSPAASPLRKVYAYTPLDKPDDTPTGFNNTELELEEGRSDNESGTPLVRPPVDDIMVDSVKDTTSPLYRVMDKVLIYLAPAGLDRALYEKNLSRSSLPSDILHGYWDTAKGQWIVDASLKLMQVNTIYSQWYPLHVRESLNCVNETTPDLNADNPECFYTISEPSELVTNVDHPAHVDSPHNKPSNYNTSTSHCFLDQFGIEKYMGFKYIGFMQELQTLVTGSAIIKPFLELCPIHNNKGHSAFSLLGVKRQLGDGIGSIVASASYEGTPLAVRVSEINSLAMTIATRCLRSVKTKEELELLDAEADLTNPATLGTQTKRYFTSAQLNISIPGEDIVLHLGASGKLHRDISDHKTAGTVALNVSLLNPKTYRGGLVHIPSGTVTPPLTKGFSIAYFQGTHAHKPVNPTPCPEESLLSGKEYRITYIAYVNELLFSRVNTKKETAHIALDYSYFIGGVKGVGIIGRTFLENAGPYFGVPFVKPALDLNGKKLTELTVARPYPSTFQEHDQVEFPMSESEWKLWMAHESPECAYSFFIAKEYEWKSWRASVFSQSSGNNCPPYSSDLKLRIRIESAWFQNPYTLAKCKFPTQKYYPDEIEGNSMKKRIDDHLLLHECTIHSLASDAEAVKIVSKPTARRPLNAAGEITTHADKSGFSLRPKIQSNPIIMVENDPEYETNQGSDTEARSSLTLNNDSNCQNGRSAGASTSRLLPFGSATGSTSGPIIAQPTTGDRPDTAASVAGASTGLENVPSIDGILPNTKGLSQGSTDDDYEMQDETGAATPAVGTLSQKRLGKQRAVEPMSDEIQDESQDENQVVVPAQTGHGTRSGASSNTRSGNTCGNESTQNNGTKAFPTIGGASSQKRNNSGKNPVAATAVKPIVDKNATVPPKAGAELLARSDAAIISLTKFQAALNTDPPLNPTPTVSQNPIGPTFNKSMPSTNESINIRNKNRQVHYVPTLDDYTLLLSGESSKIIELVSAISQIPLDVSLATSNEQLFNDCESVHQVRVHANDNLNSYDNNTELGQAFQIHLEHIGSVLISTALNHSIAINTLAQQVLIRSQMQLVAVSYYDLWELATQSIPSLIADIITSRSLASSQLKPLNSQLPVKFQNLAQEIDRAIQEKFNYSRNQFNKGKAQLPSLSITAETVKDLRIPLQSLPTQNASKSKGKFAATTMHSGLFDHSNVTLVIPGLTKYGSASDALDNVFSVVMQAALLDILVYPGLKHAHLAGCLLLDRPLYELPENSMTLSNILATRATLVETIVRTTSESLDTVLFYSLCIPAIFDIVQSSHYYVPSSNVTITSDQLSYLVLQIQDQLSSEKCAEIIESCHNSFIIAMLALYPDSADRARPAGKLGRKPRPRRYPEQHKTTSLFTLFAYINEELAIVFGKKLIINPVLNEYLKKNPDEACGIRSLSPSVALLHDRYSKSQACEPLVFAAVCALRSCSFGNTRNDWVDDVNYLTKHFNNMLPDFITPESWKATVLEARSSLTAVPRKNKSNKIVCVDVDNRTAYTTSTDVITSNGAEIFTLAAHWYKNVLLPSGNFKYHPNGEIVESTRMTFTRFIELYNLSGLPMSKGKLVKFLIAADIGELGGVVRPPTATERGDTLEFGGRRGLLSFSGLCPFTAEDLDRAPTAAEKAAQSLYFQKVYAFLVQVVGQEILDKLKITAATLEHISCKLEKASKAGNTKAGYPLETILDLDDLVSIITNADLALFDNFDMLNPSASQFGLQGRNGVLGMLVKSSPIKPIKDNKAHFDAAVAHPSWAEVEVIRLAYNKAQLVDSTKCELLKFELYKNYWGESLLNNNEIVVPGNDEVDGSRPSKSKRKRKADSAANIGAKEKKKASKRRKKSDRSKEDEECGDSSTEEEINQDDGAKTSTSGENASNTAPHSPKILRDGARVLYNERDSDSD